MKNVWTGMLVLLAVCLAAVPARAQVAELGVKHSPTAAYRWVDVLLEAAADDVERVGARPTVLSRQMAIPLTAAFDAWAAYDEKAVGTMFGGKLRRPASERTQENKETAIAYAMYRCLVDQLPFQKDDITAEMVKMGYDPNNDSMDVTTPAGIGNRVAAELLKRRHHDGANQLGDEAGGKPGEAYGDYTMYRCVNPNDRIVDPDRWQRLPFADGKGGHSYPDFLTPHWYRVKPFALESSEQFRAPPVPLVGSEELKKQVDECIEFNANLTVERKAIVEFMRDGPRSTGQSGHWLRFAQAVSRRDKQGLDEDVKLFFVVSNTAMDAFISAWESKRYYDSSRPWTLVRHYYSDTTIRGWAGPGEGVKEIPGSQWHPYSPDSFVTPPFPAYVSGHSTVSGACATMLKLFTGSDRFDAVENRKAGALTEAEHSCLEMQKVDGQLPQLKTGETMTCDVSLPMPTFWAVAEMAGISRVMGGYHIQADNIEGLNMGRKVADYSWPKYQAYFNGTAKVQGDDST